MLLLRKTRIDAFTFFVMAVLGLICPLCHAQAALLMEEPYGFFGALNPTGHNALYFENICAETPVKLRHCHPGELGSVISRYQGINGYDWIAIPLIPYLYSVEHASDVPDHVDHEMVRRMRNRYRETHLEALGPHLSPGNLVRGGWTELIGASYERRIYAFRFNTTPAQDDAIIERLNSAPNRSHFHLLFNNCADFARVILNICFPRTFGRSIFPDAGVTTPKQIAYKLVRYARKHPEIHLTVFEISQIPGYRHNSHSNKNISESFVTTAYAVPITLVNPYVFGGMCVDYLARGRHHLLPKDPPILEPGNLSALTAPPADEENPRSAGLQVPGAATGDSADSETTAPYHPGLEEITATHE
ncbi:MAG: hypothetical protein ACLGRW_11415 [Acidobacteriota bacterium]